MTERIIPTIYDPDPEERLHTEKITLAKIESNVAGLGPKPAINGMDAAEFCYSAGWHDVLTIAASLGTALSESLLCPEAFHHNLDPIAEIADGTKAKNVETGETITVVDGSAGKIRHADGTVETVPLTVEYIVSTDWGMWQLNDVSHPEFFPNGSTAIAFNPARSTEAAFDVWLAGGQSFDPWYGHKNLVYLDDYYLRRAWLAVANFGARRAVTAARARPAVIAGRTTPATKTRVPMETLSEFRKVYPAGT